MSTRTLILCLAALVSVASARTATLYVNAASTNPVPPYADWPTAAVTIQDAVDAAAPGDEIVVTNGVYQTGARAVYGMSNRVAVTKPVTVRSVNGPAVTMIQGEQGPFGSDMPVRCVYLTNGTALLGFTLTNGFTQVEVESYTNQCGGGAWCEGLDAVLSNCVVASCYAYVDGGGVFGGTLNNCTLTWTGAFNGGGACNSTLNDCTLTHSFADFGGGASLSTLKNCKITNNGGEDGGGAAHCLLSNCTLTGNSAYQGGGAYQSTLYNCTVAGNATEWQGGGTWGCTLNNCTLTGNTAYLGGGVFGSTLTNCTLTSNSVSDINGRYPEGGGAYESTLNNCILYYNSNFGDDEDGFELNYNYYGGSINYTCTTPAPGSGVGNITSEPGFVDLAGGNVRLQSNSPCINAGNNAYVAGNTDLDGHPRIVGGAVDMGAFEWQGTTRYVSAASTNPIAPYSSWEFAAVTIQDAVDAAAPGDETVVTNGVYQTGARAVYGMNNRVAVTKAVTVRSVNGPDVTIIQGAGPVGDNAIRCAYLTNGAVLAGFTLTNGVTQNFGDRATNQSGGGVWSEGPSAVVSNCAIVGCSSSDFGGGAFRGTLNNCALAGNSTTHSGGGAIDAVLNNCMLTGNKATGDENIPSENGGGGAYNSTLTNCTLTSNFAEHGGGAFGSALNNCTLKGNSCFSNGGGAYDSTLTNCTLSGNYADGNGGGAFYGTLNNCTIIHNRANEYGGGTDGCTLNNCIVYYNRSYYIPSGPNYIGGSFNYSCTTPDPGNGVGNITAEPLFVYITNAPLFVDPNGWSNLRLQSNSPCINAGNNAYVTTSTDLDGLPRIAGTRVDIGAYEFQGTGLSGFPAWLWQHGQATDGSADFADPDADGANNFQEYRSGTDPTSGLSVLRLRSPAPSGSDVAVTWQSMAGVSYALEWSTNLGAVPAFQPLAANLPGQAGLTTFTHTNGAAASPRFYRVRVP